MFPAKSWGQLQLTLLPNFANLLARLRRLNGHISTTTPTNKTCPAHNERTKVDSNNVEQHQLYEKFAALTPELRNIIWHSMLKPMNRNTLDPVGLNILSLDDLTGLISEGSILDRNGIKIDVGNEEELPRIFNTTFAQHKQLLRECLVEISTGVVIVFEKPGTLRRFGALIAEFSTANPDLKLRFCVSLSFFHNRKAFKALTNRSAGTDCGPDVHVQDWMNAVEFVLGKVNAVHILVNQPWTNYFLFWVLTIRLRDAAGVKLLVGAERLQLDHIPRAETNLRKTIAAIMNEDENPDPWSAFDFGDDI